VTHDSADYDRDLSLLALRGDIREKLSAAGAEPVGSTVPQFASFVKAEYDKWGKVVKLAGIYHGQ
jgi:tripartite-type tricarboxylate transporter receptor subunit TctC